jgi:hypothetical protein
MADVRKDEAARRAYMRQYRNAYKERVRRVGLSLTREEHSRAEMLAAESGMALSAYLKQAAFSYADGLKPVSKELVERLDELLRQIRGIATNVNQMARHSNRLKAGVEDAEVMLMLRFLDQKIREFLSRGRGGGGAAP